MRAFTPFFPGNGGRNLIRGNSRDEKGESLMGVFDEMQPVQYNCCIIYTTLQLRDYKQGRGEKQERIDGMVFFL